MSNTSWTLPGLSALGRGYNVLGRYACTTSCTQPLFTYPDTTATTTQLGRTYSYPADANIDLLTIDQTSLVAIAGMNRSEYMESLDSDTSLSGDYGFFSGSLSVDFSSKTIEEDESAFVTIRWLWQMWRMTLLAPAKLTLTDTFKADLEGTNALTPRELFDTYGTHFVKSCSVGGRMDINSSVSKSTYSSSSDLTVAAELNCKDEDGSLTAKEKLEYASQLKTFSENAEISILAEGGNQTDGKSIVSGDTDSFTKWEETVQDQPVMVAFDDNSLEPIWSLCTDETRAEELETFYPEYMSYRLTYQITDNVVSCGTDDGSGAKGDVTFYKPGGLSDGYCWIGQSAQNNYDSPVSSMTELLIVKPSRLGAVAKPTGYEMIWSDAGSGDSKNYSLWRPIPPINYVALGYLARFNVGDYNAPSGDEIADFVCIHKSLAAMNAVALGSSLWTDKGCGADKDGSVWRIYPSDGSLSFLANTFYAEQGYSQPTTTLTNVGCALKSKCDKG